MSLIYDALRSLPAAEKPVPVRGSVTDGRLPLVRRMRRMAGVGGALVVVMMAGLMFLLGRQADGPAAELRPAAVQQPEVALVPGAMQSAAQGRAADAVATVAGSRREWALVEPLRPVAVESPAPAPQALVPLQPAPVAGDRPARAAAMSPDQPAAAAASPAAPRLVTRPQAAPAPRVVPTSEAADKAVVELSVIDVGDSLRRFNGMVGRGEFDAAAKLLDELRARGLNRLALARMSAYLALRAERLDDARRDYEQVLALLPSDREAGLNLAIIDVRQGFSVQAEQRLRTLAELHPDDVQVRAMLGRIRAQGSVP